jgi:hypothetical protein
MLHDGYSRPVQVCTPRWPYLWPVLPRHVLGNGCVHALGGGGDVREQRHVAALPAHSTQHAPTVLQYLRRLSGVRAHSHDTKGLKRQLCGVTLSAARHGTAQ